MLSLITLLLHMDDLSVNLVNSTSRPCYSAVSEPTELPHTWEDGSSMVVSFSQMLLDIFHDNLLPGVPETLGVGGIASEAKQALEWRVSNVKVFTEDWKWRLSILQHLLPLSGHPWKWKEALAILRAAPSKLLNL